MSRERLTLIRSKLGPPCAFGDLFAFDGERIAVTLEEPWLDNADNVSCVPPGIYEWFKRESPKRGYEVIELRDVPDRENVQIHIGNTTKDTEGCILVGSGRGEDGKSITGSKLAFQKLMTELKDTDAGTIEIVNP